MKHSYLIRFAGALAVCFAIVVGRSAWAQKNAPLRASAHSPQEAMSLAPVQPIVSDVQWSGTPGGTKGAAQGAEADRQAAIDAPLVVAVCSPTVRVNPGLSPAGYLPLSGFAIMPVAGVSDDTVTNFTVPAYTFGGQSFTQIGFSSNGYAVIGGSTGAADNQFVPQFFPNPNRPNNVLAPYWADLNPSAGGALRIGILTDMMDQWIVLDWENVAYFAGAGTVSFQIWIGIDGDGNPGEDITYTYGTIDNASMHALTVGAENRFGDRGENNYFSFLGGGVIGTPPVSNTTELRVTTGTTTECQNQAREMAIGLTTDNRLLTFYTNAPGMILNTVPITGLAVGETVIGIDYRPANGVLYGLVAAVDMPPQFSTRGLVTLNPVTGAAAVVGTPNSLAGDEFGFDFNPKVDLIRVVNDFDQNARLNPTTGATAGTDAVLTYAGTDLFSGFNPNVTGAAYTNNVAGATTTTLYDIDSNLDILVTQGSPGGMPTSPNSGQLFTVGSLGVNTTDLVGFDVSGNTGIAYASLTNPVPPPSPSPSPAPSATPGPSSLYTVNLAAGNATLVGQVGSTPTSLRDISISPLPVTDPVLRNLSTRMQVGTGQNVAIGGFIVRGAVRKHVIVRALGPELMNAGLTGFLVDPVLELHGPAGFMTIMNDNWRDTQQAAIAATGIPPTNDAESAIVADLEPGAYTALVSGKNGTQGLAMVEVYDLDPSAPSALANLSTRAFVNSGNNLVIAGFILGQAAGNDNVVIRGLGPSMTAAGVSNVLSDPALQLRDSNGTLVRSNNDWQDDPAQAAAISGVGLDPSNPVEAAIFATLPAGAYTALLVGQNGVTGVGLVEIYQIGMAP